MFSTNKMYMKSRFQRYGLLTITIILLSGSARSQYTYPRNIILFIGDGMGVSHVTAAKTVSGTLAMERFPVIGLVTTHSHDRYITDSAAAGTAMAAGVKTYNGAISVAPDSSPVETVLEIAESAGMATGLVATCSVTHATPASFAAHVDNRSKQTLIAEQMVRSGVDVLLGGGLGFFIPSGQEGSLREDDKDLLAGLRDTYAILLDDEAFRAWSGTGRVIGLFAPEHLPSADRRPVSLADMTQKAILALSQHPDGFFLMVEGSQIDWEAHDNESEGIIRETIDFDEAVGHGIDFAVKNGETLVIVTADHETGGYAVEQGSVEMQVVTWGDFTTNSHTGTMVPLFAYGPSAEKFGGIRDNTCIGLTLKELIRAVHATR